MIVKYRTCNCTSDYMPEGIIRTLLIMQRPELKGLSTEPCPHWQEVKVEKPKHSKQGSDEAPKK